MQCRIVEEAQPPGKAPHTTPIDAALYDRYVGQYQTAQREIFHARDVLFSPFLPSHKNGFLNFGPRIAARVLFSAHGWPPATTLFLSARTRKGRF